nr:23 kDa jasmonate-induced protein-like [Malus domestica]
MASNVFGNPITNATLEGMPEYIGKRIDKKDRAHVAMYKKNDQGKDVDARTHVENLKKQYGIGVSSLCLVYNATGDTLTYVTCIDWYGHIGTSPYQIANGQWGVFLHVKTAGQATGSVAAVVYRGKNAVGSICDWMLAWRNPWNRHLFTNTVDTDIGPENHFKAEVWRTVYNRLVKNGLCVRAQWNGCLSTISTGCFTSPVVEAILTLE